MKKLGVALITLSSCTEPRRGSLLVTPGEENIKKLSAI